MTAMTALANGLNGGMVRTPPPSKGSPHHHELVHLVVKSPASVGRLLGSNPSFPVLASQVV